WPNGPEGAMWRADRHTLVAALLPEDFDHIPAKPRATGPLPELMNRLDPAALAWLVASVDANNGTLAFLAGRLPAGDRDAWSKLEALAVSVRDEGGKLSLIAHLRSEEHTSE